VHIAFRLAKILDGCPRWVEAAAVHAAARALGFTPADGPETRLVKPASWSWVEESY